VLTYPEPPETLKELYDPVPPLYPPPQPVLPTPSEFPEVYVATLPPLEAVLEDPPPLPI
jgi:hypothetical protein